VAVAVAVTVAVAVAVTVTVAVAVAVTVAVAYKCNVDMRSAVRDAHRVVRAQVSRLEQLLSARLNGVPQDVSW
jgi:hypothetical protein